MTVLDTGVPDRIASRSNLLITFCAQSVVTAFNDKLNLDFETALKLSSSFGGGMGRLREVCGAVTGMFIVVGLLYGYDDAHDRKQKAEHYKLVQELAAKFKEQNKSIVCRELLGLKGADNYMPEIRTEEYYSKRPCKQLVGIAAQILEDYINQKEDRSNENSSSM